MNAEKTETHLQGEGTYEHECDKTNCYFCETMNNPLPEITEHIIVKQSDPLSWSQKYLLRNKFGILFPHEKRRKISRHYY